MIALVSHLVAPGHCQCRQERLASFVEQFVNRSSSAMKARENRTRSVRIAILARISAKKEFRNTWEVPYPVHHGDDMFRFQATCGTPEPDADAP